MMMISNLDIPAWVNWLAQDSDGSWWGYSAEPHLHDTGWYENEVGDCIRLGEAETTSSWRESLQRVTPGQLQPPHPDKRVT